MSDFGERVDLTANLASILRRYPFSVGLFREIIQNSEDAKATKQVFILDRRTYNCTSLLRPSLAHLQGPAFLACNNEVFSDEDWEAIRNVSQSSKAADTEKIGKHGLGSRAYYHLTDNPQYLSGGHLAIFDPHRWAFEHGGWRETLENMATQYVDHLEPFCKATNEDIRTYYSGTVVRLALRTASSDSRISSDKPSADKIHALLVDFIQKELHLVLLFLSHLTSIEVREIDASGRIRTLATATAHCQALESPQCSDPSATFALARRKVVVEYDASVQPPSSPPSGDWFIYRASFPPEECVRSLSANLRDNSDHIQQELTREKLRPEVALAFQGASPQPLSGRLFTYLPLPLDTNFPCHIHGVFSLSDARQNLRNPSETIMSGTADALAVAWNKLLFSSLIPRVWLACLESVASGSPSLDMYQMLPPRQGSKASGDSQYWATLLHDVLRLAETRNAKIWPVFTSSVSAPATYTALSDGLIASEDDDVEQLRMLAKAGVIIALPPPAVHVALLEIAPTQALTPKTVRSRLIAAPHLPTMSRAESNIVLEFLLRDGRLEDLVDVPVIPLTHGGTVALTRRMSGSASYVLFSKEDTKLFRDFEQQAVALYDLPVTTKSLLVSEGSLRLNVVTLNCAKAGQYIREAASKFPSAGPSGGSWPWTQSCEWLGLFWRWIEECSFGADLLNSIRSLPLLPTTTFELCTPNDHIFSSSPLSDSLSRIGVKFLHSDVPHAFLQQYRPTILRSVSEPSDLLDALESVSKDTIRGDGEAAKILGEHLSRHLNIYVRLTNRQRDTLRSLPIHLVLVNNPMTNNIKSQLASLPAKSRVYCLTSITTLPLPAVHNTTFVHITDTSKALLEQVDLASAVHPLSEEDLLQLHVDHIVKQSPTMRLRILKHLIAHPKSQSPLITGKLRKSSIVRVLSGQDAAPEDVIDSESPISAIIAAGDPNAIFVDNGVNSQLARDLASLGLLRRELDATYVIQRIKSFHMQGASSLDAARRLLQTLESTYYSCSGVEGIDEIAWIPTKAGLRTARETRDASQRMLCDRVWDLLDMPESLRSAPLRRMLGWHDPIPIDVLIEQLRRLLSEPPTKEDLLQYLLELVTEFGRRYLDLLVVPRQVDELFDLLRAQNWVPTSDGLLRQAPFAIFESSSRLRGFGQISLDFAARTGVKDFLLRMGCAIRPTNDAIIMQLEALHQEGQPGDMVHESIELLDALQPASLTEQQRVCVLVPGVDTRLHTVNQLFYNDLGSRMQEFVMPQSRYQVHARVSESFCDALKIPTLGSLNLETHAFVSEDMREDLTTRVGNVLRAYHIDQAFNEFLANADDAGATRFSIMLDNEPKREASRGTVLCDSMVKFCRGPALVVHNNAEFSEDDFRGICRIGRGGKEDRDESIGRFGLGSLSFYHFAEVAMILSGSRLLLLDPSGRFLPQHRNSNSLIVPLDNLRRVYPGHLHVFDGLFGFRLQDNADYYKGTIIRLPLRTSEQAKKSALSNKSFTIHDIHSMLMRYRPTASRSLFFIGVSEVAARQSGEPATLWSTSAHRRPQPLVEGESFNVQTVALADVDEYGHSQRSEWVVISSTIPRDCYRQWESVIAKNRVKNVTVAVAGELDRGLHGYQDSQAHLFASLPLPLTTSLPVHVHASFILADDRRNVRWDGDGLLTEDSQFNRWLLTAMLPPLYLFALERWMAGDFPSSKVVPWPGISKNTPDPMSRAFIDAFYGDVEGGLLGSARRVLRSVTGDLIHPVSAVFRGGEPKAIKEILLHLQPSELVELPKPVRDQLFKLALGRVRRVDPAFVSQVLAHKRDTFMTAYKAGSFTAAEVEDCVKYLMDDGEVSDRLIGLPLLPLAHDGSLAEVQRADGSPLIFAGGWTVHPWPLFPAQRFLHLDFDYELLLGKGLNVSPFEGTAITSLMRNIIPEVPRWEASTVQAQWVVEFWRFWKTLRDQTPDCLKDFPLIPTTDDNVFLTITDALVLPSLGSPISSLSHIANILEKLGAVIIRDTNGTMTRYLPVDRILPIPVRERLRTVEFSFRRVMEFFNHLRQVNDDLEQKFSKLSKDERSQLAQWIKDSLRGLPTFMPRQPGEVSFLDIARHLPIWTAYRKGTTGPPALLSLTDPLVRILPSTFRLVDRGVVLFLGKNAELFFVEHSTEISCLENVTPMSAADLVAQLDFPAQLPTSRFATYRALLDGLLALSRHHNGSLPGLKVPNEDRDLVDPRTIYKSSVAEFRAAFANRPQNFIHERFRQDSLEDRLVPFGIHGELTPENFLVCVQAIDEDFRTTDDEGRAAYEERCSVIFRWYSSRLPLTVGSDDAWWRRLDSYSFILRRTSRRSGGPTAFRDTEYAATLPDLVPPGKVLREEYSKVAWSQRALFVSEPDVRLYMADKVVGVPAVEEVVAHLRVLTLRIAPRHHGDHNLLVDIKATYEFLTEREAEARPHLRKHRRERLFLNVNDPLEDTWQFCAASKMMFNVPDGEDRHQVRAFLHPFRKLLLAAGADEIKLPTAPIFTVSPAEEELSRLRASFDGLRQSKILTDVMFRVSGCSGEDLAAHRALLATASEYFRDQFSGHFSESGLASAQQPIVINLENRQELRCARLILDHIYTGHFDDTQKRSTLLALLQLANRWEVTEVKTRAEILLVNMISPESYLELKDYAEEVGATILLEKVEEFIRENALVLEELLEVDEL